ncbi:MAG TPA: hypothetical protein VJ898_10570, partial [Natrialbaceae archaeon]|nr:hypothetical protein [Natrialbaceae archaeon]
FIAGVTGDGMASEWMDDYEATDDRNEQYGLLRTEMTRLRNDLVSQHMVDGEFDWSAVQEYFDPEAVAETIREASRDVEGDLLVFVANDFGFPAAFRPEGTDRAIQNDVRLGILERKYDDEAADLQSIRDDLLDAHPGIHKAIVAEYTGDDVRYFLPAGQNETTNFLTVREMVGLVDYTTNSAQADDLSRTY